jgi:hypothetical protein
MAYVPHLAPDLPYIPTMADIPYSPHKTLDHH